MSQSNSALFTFIRSIPASESTFPSLLAFDDTDSVHSICHSSTFGSVVTDTFLNDNAKFQFIHISNDKTYKYQDIFDAISKLLEREVKIIHIDPIKLKSLNKGKYEEIIYDKNPSFTLNNKRAKEVSRNTNFDVDIIESLRSTLQNLEKEDKEEDIEYNMLSDALISEYTNLELPENEKAYAQDYYRQLSNQEKLAIKIFKMKRRTKSRLRPIVHKLIRNKKMRM